MDTKMQPLLLVLAFFLLLSSAQAQGITIAPPPSITSNILLHFSDSPNDGKLIASKRIQNLQLSSISQNGSIRTEFKINFFNRKAPGNLDTYNFTQNGNWTFVKSSLNTLSCSIVTQVANNTVGLLYFDSQNKIFKLLGKLPVSTFTNRTLDQVLIEEMKHYIFIGEKCLTGIYIGGTHLTSYRLDQDRDQLVINSAIPKESAQAFTDDITYGILNGKLSRYNINTFAYQPIFTFPSSNRFTIKNSGKRLLVVSSNSTEPDNTTMFNSNYTIYVLNDLSTGLITVATLSLVNTRDYGLMEVSSSPLITKIGFGYMSSTGDLQIVAKHIDYTQKTMVDLLYQNPTAYFQTVSSFDGQRQLDFDDNFLVVRNGSTYTNGSSNSFVEQGYQFVGTQIVLLNRRDLINNPNNHSQFFKFKITSIDPTNAQKLIVLNLYSKNSTNYELVEFVYGNFASTQQIVVTPSPAYMTFTEPTYSAVVANDFQFQWSYFNPINSSANTNVTVFRVDNNTANHYIAASYQLTGQWTLLYQNVKCQVLTSGNTAFSIYKLESSGAIYQLFGDATSVLSGLSFSANDVWQASFECDRLRLNQKVYARVNANAFQEVSNTPNFSPIDLDNSLTYAINSDSTVWKFDPSINGYAQVLSPPIAGGYRFIESAQNKVVVYSSVSGQANVAAYVANANGTFSNCLNYTQGFTGMPQIQISPKLTKVLIFGTLNAAKKADMYYVDYQNFTNQNIPFPENIIFNPQLTYVSLDDAFIYIRQLYDPSISARDDQQFAYFFAQNIILKSVFSSIYVKDTTTSVWQKSFIVNGQSSSYLLTETLEKSTAPKDRVIRSKELNAQAAQLNSNNNALCQIEMINGQVKMCPRGCSTCDCNSCVSGFVLDSSTKICVACAPGCIICTIDSLSTCTSCFSGFFLSSTNKCQPCQSPCVACITSATSCTKCPPGQYFSTGMVQCDLCPLNCFNCTNSSACVTCQPGFVLNPSNKCRKCSIKCSSCQPTKITQCTSCSKGLQLLNGDCVSCASNCLSCSNGVCADCANGYTPNSSGVCVPNCKLPCITCVDNQPTQCLSCQSGSILSGSSCQLNTTCNGTTSCSYCGQGLNYYLFPSGIGAVCLSCPLLSNCIQCSQSNTYKCTICVDTYYVNQDSGCSVCSSNCTSCISDTVCLGCVGGFTLLDGYSQGQCLQCKSPCATCLGSTTYCTSCVTGFTKQSWMCQNNTRITLTIVLNDAASSILNNIDAVVAGILKLINQTDINVLTLSTITSGSSILGVSLSPTLMSLSAAASVLTTSLPNGIPGTSYSVTGIQVVQTGVNTITDGTPTTPSQNNGNRANVGLIVGLTVGLTLGVAVIIIIVVVRVRKAKQVPIFAQDNHLNGIHGIQLKQSSIVELSNSGPIQFRDTTQPGPSTSVDFEKHA